MQAIKHPPFAITTTLSIILILLLPGCGPHKKQPSPKAKKQTWGLFTPSTTYRQKKETIQQKQAIKKKMREELPSRLKDMNEQELKKARAYSLELGYIDMAVKYITRLIIVTQDQALRKKLRLELADIFFERGEFEKAGKLYSQFLEYYPGSEQREYVEYKAILCRFYDTLQSDRDQTKTRETLALTQRYLNKTDVYSQYVQDVQDIQHKSYIKLVESEIDIFHFNLRRKHYKSAEIHLRYIKDHYLSQVQEFEPDILKLEIELAQGQGDMQHAQQKQIELATRFGKQSTITLAQTKQTTDHVTRF